MRRQKIIKLAAAPPPPASAHRRGSQAILAAQAQGLRERLNQGGRGGDTELLTFHWCVGGGGLTTPFLFYPLVLNEWSRAEALSLVCCHDGIGKRTSKTFTEKL